MGHGGSQTALPCSQNLSLVPLGPGHTIRHRSHKLGTNSHNNKGYMTAEVTKHCLGHTAWPRSHFIAWVTFHSPGPVTWPRSYCMVWVTRMGLSLTVYHTTSPFKITWITQLGLCILHSPDHCELLGSQHKAWIRPQFIFFVLLFLNVIFNFGTKIKSKTLPIALAKRSPVFFFFFEKLLFVGLLNLCFCNQRINLLLTQYSIRRHVHVSAFQTQLSYIMLWYGFP